MLLQNKIIKINIYPMRVLGKGYTKKNGSLKKFQAEKVVITDMLVRCTCSSVVAKK